jgi:hypothetical protein
MSTKLQIFHNSLISAANSIAFSASSAAPGYPAENARNVYRRAKVWRATGCAAEWIGGDFGMTAIPKALAITGPRNKPLKLTPAATITLQLNSVNTWTSPAFSQTVPWDEKTLLLANTAGLGTGYRYWRLSIADAANPYGYVELGITYLGDLWTPSRGAITFPLKVQNIDPSAITISEGGSTFADPRQQTAKISFDIEKLTTAEKEELEAIYQTFGQSIPFFISLDPGAVFGSSANYHCRYVKFSADPEATFVSPNNWTMRVELREEV